jgi:predicted SAM-dependent methyltransferase
MWPEKTFYKILTRLPIIPKKHTCEICNSKVFKFIPLPKFYSDNAAKYGFPYTSNDFETIDVNNFFCPKCFSLDRERLFVFYLKRMHQFKKNDLLLEFAPSPGFAAIAEKAFSVQYKTCDLYMDNVDYKLDIQDLSSIKNNSVDFIICSHVLEHIPDDKKAMQNMYAILKNRGKAIMMVPILKNSDAVDEDSNCNDVSERWKRFGQDDHIRLYSRKVFVERLEEAGFKIEILEENKFDKNELSKYGVPNNFALYIASKS